MRSAIKLDETTLIFQFIRPRIPAVNTVVIKALTKGSITNQTLPKNKKSIKAKIKATPTPKTARSDFINDIISTAIIEGPPRNRSASPLYVSKIFLILLTRTVCSFVSNSFNKEISLFNRSIYSSSLFMLSRAAYRSFIRVFFLTLGFITICNAVVFPSELNISSL